MGSTNLHLDHETSTNPRAENPRRAGEHELLVVVGGRRVDADERRRGDGNVATVDDRSDELDGLRVHTGQGLEVSTWKKEE